MSGETKIMLSDSELAKVMDSEWILTKTAIIQKLFTLFEQQVPVIQKVWQAHQPYWPAELSAAVPRIFKGEQYRGLPYVIMDYPCLFGKPDIIAIRTMFWWGNFFSISLQVSGAYFNDYAELFLQAIQRSGEAFYISVHEDAWEHHFDESNYIDLPSFMKVSGNRWLADQQFLKLALKFELKDWNNMPVLLAEGYQKVFSLLKT